jgi:hypothetical protein
MSKTEKISIAFQGETESIEFSSNFSVLEKKIKKAFDLGEKLIKATFTGKDLGGITSFEDEESFKKFLTLSKRPKKLKIEVIEKKQNPILTTLKQTLTKEFEETLREKIKESINEKIFEENAKRYDEPEDNIVYKNIICNNCLQKDIQNILYMCAECNNVNFCEECAFNNFHSSQHSLIKIPILIKQTVDGMSAFFPDNNKEIVLTKQKTIEIKIINNGSKTISKCFLTPIVYGEQYLTGNNKSLPTMNPNQQETISINLNIGNQKGKFLTKWRIFNSNGIPFGDVLSLSVIIP